MYTLFCKLAIAVQFIITLSQSKCVPAKPSSFNFTSEEHIIKLNGNEFHIKGAAWFGTETTSYVPDGLWAVSWSSLLDFLVKYKFNAIRLPFCVDGVNENPMPPKNIIDYNYNPELINMTSLQVYDFIIEQAGNRGLLVMLDMHRLNCNGQSGLWQKKLNHKEHQLTRITYSSKMWR